MHQLTNKNTIETPLKVLIISRGLKGWCVNQTCLLLHTGTVCTERVRPPASRPSSPSSQPPTTWTSTTTKVTQEVADGRVVSCHPPQTERAPSRRAWRRTRAASAARPARLCSVSQHFSPPENTCRGRVTVGAAVRNHRKWGGRSAVMTRHSSAVSLLL